MSAPAPNATFADALPGLPVVVIGLVFLFGAQYVVRFIQGGLAWQRRNLADPTIGLQEKIVGSRALLWFLRLVGAMILLGAAVSVSEALA